jgi:hypothetical protein
MPNIKSYLATPGAQTGNNTHTSVALPDPLDQHHSIDFVFVVEAVGGTPTVTFKWQVSADDPALADASSTFVDVNYVTDASDTPATATRSVTAVGVTHEWIAYVAAAENRQWRKARLVTTSNTNVTYHGEIRVNDAKGRS